MIDDPLYNIYTLGVAPATAMPAYPIAARYGLREYIASSAEATYTSRSYAPAIDMDGTIWSGLCPFLGFHEDHNAGPRHIYPKWIHGSDAGVNLAVSRFLSDDTIRDGEWIRQIAVIGYDTTGNEQRFQLCLLSFRPSNGDIKQTVISLPRRYTGLSYTCRVVHADTTGMVVLFLDPMAFFYIPYDRPAYIKNAEDMVQYRWVTSAIREYQTFCDGRLDIFRSFRAPGNTGFPKLSVAVSPTTEAYTRSSSDSRGVSLALCINHAERTANIRYFPDIRYVAAAVSNDIPSPGFAARSQLGLWENGLMSWRTGARLFAVGDFYTGANEAYILPESVEGFGWNIYGTFISPYEWLRLQWGSPSTSVYAVSGEHFDLRTGNRTILFGTPGTYTTATYPVGHKWRVKANYPVRDDAGGIILFDYYTVSFYGEMGDAVRLGSRYGTSVLSSDDSRLGFLETKWDKTYVKRITTRKGAFRPDHILSKSDTFDAGIPAGLPDGTILTAVKGRYRHNTPESFTPAEIPEADPVLDKGKVLVVKASGGYEWVPPPSPLPDWFNGCTPVLDPALQRWRAGDALFHLPRVNRDGVIFMAKDKRWEPYVLPWSARGATPTETFTTVTSDVPNWFAHISGNFRHWASDALPPADGVKQGYLWRAPDHTSRRIEGSLEDAAVCGALTNYFWNGAQDISNRRFTNMSPAFNTGVGRWEPGDMIDTIRPNLDTWHDGWQKMDGFMVGCRLNNWEPSCFYGETHRDLYHMLGRFMSRQWAKGALTRNIPIRFQARVVSREDDAVLETFDTEFTQTGWQFEHADGGQSVFLPTGPTATTVVGVVFDVYYAGFSYDATLHYVEWRKSVSGAEFTEWERTTTHNLETMWWSSALIENPRFVNHVVIPELGDPPFSGDASFVDSWMYLHDEARPVGGALIHVPCPTSVSGLSAEITVADGVDFSQGETSTPSLDPDAWSICLSGGITIPFVDAPPNDALQIRFDPRAAGFTSRVGSRYYRWRTSIAGVPGRWRIGTTCTTESTMLRTDNMEVMGLEADRVVGSPLTFGRMPKSPFELYSNKFDKTKGLVVFKEDRDDVPADGVLQISNAEDDGRPVLVLSHGMYDQRRGDSLYRATTSLHNRRRDLQQLPPMHTIDAALVVSDHRPTVTGRQATNRVISGCRAVVANGFSQIAQNAASHDYISGSRMVTRTIPEFDVYAPLQLYGGTISVTAPDAYTAMRYAGRTALSEDGRFLSIYATRTAYTLSASNTESDGGVFDLVLGVGNFDIYRRHRNMTFPITIADGLFWNWMQSTHELFSTVFEPRSGLFKQTMVLPFWEDGGVNANPGDAWYGVVDNLPTRGSMIVRQYGTKRRTWRREANDSWIMEEDPYLSNKYDLGIRTSLWKYDEESFTDRGGTGYSPNTGSSVYFQVLNRHFNRMSDGYVWWNGVPGMPIVYLSSGVIAPFPMYSGMFPRTAFSDNNGYLTGHTMSLNGMRAAQAPGDKSSYDRYDCGVYDWNVGGGKPYIPVRNVTSTATYINQSATAHGPGRSSAVTSPQDYSTGALYVVDLVGEVSFSDRNGDGRINLSIGQDEGR